MTRKLFWGILWILILGFIVLYPLLISKYVSLPLFIGFSGYLIVLGIDGHGKKYIWLPLLYLMNLEANLALPMFLTLFTVLLFYLTLYERIRYFKRCSICVGLLSVIAIDFYYFIVLLGYDFIFDSTSIFIDSILLYSMVFDLIFVVLL